MQTTISLQVKPSEAANEQILREYIARALGKPLNTITGFYRLKQSIDARNRKQVWINCSLAVFIDEPFHTRVPLNFNWQDVSQAKKKVVVVGAGPAGLFAALQLIERGIQPIIIERGKDVRSRRRDLAFLNKEGIVNPESNYCFGEGGAGTYSDGKLYTRSSKRGDINRILQLFYLFGAEENILYEAHPHIGTNKLPQIIVAMREHILHAGGRIIFEKKLTDFTIKQDQITAVVTADGETISGDAVILATGHSARDIFHLLHQKNILIEAKPFALGVRVEHPQKVIDEMQYHTVLRDGHLPPASYSIVEQVNQRGVFSFCMCPGGIIAPAATNPGELVVNGWSPSKRNNPFANSGMVVQVTESDAYQFLNKVSSFKNHPLNLLAFQQSVEKTAFIAGGSNLQAPAQRMVDFCTHKISAAMPACSYLPGVQSAELSSILPDFITLSLQKGLQAISKKMKGYYSNEALLVATESRTYSPVRIPRNPTTLAHPQIKNLYPCGEGAGYAGGIVSAAMDGERVANLIALQLTN